MRKKGQDIKGRSRPADNAQLEFSDVVNEQMSSEVLVENAPIFGREVQSVPSDRNDIGSADLAPTRTLTRASLDLQPGLPSLVPETGDMHETFAREASRCDITASLDNNEERASSGHGVEPYGDLLIRFPSLAAHQNYRPTTTKGKLVAYLNECLRVGRIPRSKRDTTQISRVFFAQKVGVTHGMLTQSKDILKAYEAVLEHVEPVSSLPDAPKFGADPEHGEPMDDAARYVVSLYPELLKHQHYAVDSTARAIVRILNLQIVSGGLERSRGGKISRRAITSQLGLSSTATVPYLPILVDYEDAVGGKESVHEANIPAMRSWLEEQFNAGTLEIRDGKVSRKQFTNHFGLPQNTTIFLRYPRIAAVMEEVDDRIKSTGYVPGPTRERLGALEAILADDPPVSKDGRSIHRKEVAKLIGIPEGNLRRFPFAERLRDADLGIVKSLEEDPLTAFAGGRIFKFRCLVEQGWPETYAIRAKTCFERLYRTKKKEEAKTCFAGLIELFAFLAGNGSQYCRSLFHGLGNGVRPNSLRREFTMAAQEYREHLRAANENTDTCNAKISVTNGIIRKLSADSILPSLTLYLIQYRSDKKNHGKTVAEAVESEDGKRSKPHVDDYLMFATSMLKQAAELRQIELSSLDQSDFNKVLREELEREQFTAADNPATLILRILDRRLTLIRNAAWAMVQEGQRLLEHGQELLERGRDPGELFDVIVRKGKISEPVRVRLLHEHFPDGHDCDQGIANLLRVVADRYNWIYPSNKDGRSEGQFFQKRALKYGGAKTLQAYLIPSQDTMAAVLTLYLLESGSNVSVGRTLYFDCIETTEEPHHSKVTGYKARAGGKPIFAVMEDRCEAVKAMKWLQEAVGRIPELVPETRKQLFISRGVGEEIKLIEEFTYRAAFKRLIETIPELANLTLTPNMIRPSVLLKAALEAGGLTRLSRAMGQQSPQVHEGYVNKYPMRFLRDTEIYHFQHALETAVVSGIENAHEILGVDVDGMARRIESVMKTGLGTLCKNQKGRPGNDGAACTSIDCWNDCPQLIVIAKKEEIAILQIWQHSLRLVEGDWIRDQPERWERVWLPWLCFVDAVEVKMRSTFGPVWKAATAISEKIIANPNFQPMRLF